MARLLIPARRTAVFTALCTADSWKWCRYLCPDASSKYVRVAGNTHCHGHSRLALGLLGAWAVVLSSNGDSNLIEKLRRRHDMKLPHGINAT